MPPKKKPTEYNTRVQTGNDILLSYFVTRDQNNIVCTIQRFFNIVRTSDPENISGFYGGFNNAKNNSVTPAMSKKLSYKNPGGGVISKSAYFNVLIPTDLGEMHYMPIVLGTLEIDQNGRIKIGDINSMISNVLIFNTNMFVYDRNGRRINDLGTFLQYKDQVTIYFHLLPNTTGRLILKAINEGQYTAVGRNAYDDVTPYIYNVNDLLTPSELANVIAEEMAILVDQNNINLINIDNQINNNNNADYVREDERDEVYTEIELPRIIRSDEDDIRSTLPIDPSDKKILAVLEDMKSGLYPDVDPDQVPDINDFNPIGDNYIPIEPDINPVNFPNAPLAIRPINRLLPYVRILLRAQDLALREAQNAYNQHIRKLALISVGCSVLIAYGVYLLYAYKGSYANILVDTVYDWVNALSNYNEYKRDYLELYREDRPIQGPEYNDLYDPNRPIQGPEYNDLYDPNRPIQGPEYNDLYDPNRPIQGPEYNELYNPDRPIQGPAPKPSITLRNNISLRLTKALRDAEAYFNFLEDLYYYRKATNSEQSGLVDPNRPYYGFEQQILNDLCDVIKVRIPESNLLLPDSIPVRYSSDQIGTLPSAGISVSQAYQSTAEIGSLLMLANGGASLNRSYELGVERLSPTQLDHLMGPVTSQVLGYVSNAMIPIPSTPTGLIEVEPYSPTSVPTISATPDNFTTAEPIIMRTAAIPTPRSRPPSNQQAPWKVNFNKNEPIPTSTPYTETPSITFTPTQTPTQTPTSTPGVTISISPELSNKLEKYQNLSTYIAANATAAAAWSWEKTKEWTEWGWNTGVDAFWWTYGQVKDNGLKLISKVGWGAVDVGIEAAKQGAKIGLGILSESTGLIIAAAVALVGYVFLKNR